MNEQQCVLSSLFFASMTPHTTQQKPTQHMNSCQDACKFVASTTGPMTVQTQKGHIHNCRVHAPWHCKKEHTKCTYTTVRVCAYLRSQRYTVSSALRWSFMCSRHAIPCVGRRSYEQHCTIRNAGACAPCSHHPLRKQNSAHCP